MFFTLFSMRLRYGTEWSDWHGMHESQNRDWFSDNKHSESLEGSKLKGLKGFLRQKTFIHSLVIRTTKISSDTTSKKSDYESFSAKSTKHILYLSGKVVMKTNGYPDYVTAIQLHEACEEGK